MEVQPSCSLCDSKEATFTICVGCSSKVNYNRLRVFTAIYSSRAGLTVTQVALRTGMHRNAVRGHINSLEDEGLILVKYYGATKFCRIPKRHPQS